MSQTYVAILDGVTIGRPKTTARKFSHAIVGRSWAKGAPYQVLAWCGREDLAAKELNKWLAYPDRKIAEAVLKG